MKSLIVVLTLSVCIIGVISKGKRPTKPKPTPKPTRPTIPPVSEKNEMPNINYFLRGYNIMKGNPHQVSVSSVDPGFQEPIFSLDYENGDETPDGLYQQPDGTLITMCQSCSLSAVTKRISGMNSYRDSLSEKVKISGQHGSWLWWNYRFSGSADYKKVQSGIYQYSNIYTQSDASCCAYQIQTDTYSRPEFSKDFNDGYAKLPEKYVTDDDKAMYRQFIESFGTHYIKQADMGSLFGQQSKLEKESWKQMLREGLDIEWSASLSTIFAFGGWSKTVNLDHEEHAHTASTFNNFSSSRSLYTKGSQPPTNIDSKNAIKEWMEEAKKYPAPISLELESILNLFEEGPIYDNLKLALDNYCGERSCDEIQETSWMPWLTSFGGQRSEPVTCNADDHITWIQMARGGFIWPWLWDFGLYDLCFQCNTESDPKCFVASYPPQIEWPGNKMICPDNGFQKMRTFDTTFDPIIGDFNHTVNVQAQCNDDTLAQDAFSFWFPDSHFPWVSCDDGQKISGFQVYKNGDDRITNIRFKCT